MSISKIDLNKCNRCGMCENYCPVDVIRIDKDTKEPIVKYPEDCMVCGLCEDRCATKAITVSPEKINAAISCWG